MIERDALRHRPVETVVEAEVHDVLGERGIVGHLVAFNAEPRLFRAIDIANGYQVLRQAVRPELAVVVVADDDDGVNILFDQPSVHFIERGEHGIGLRLFVDLGR